MIWQHDSTAAHANCFSGSGYVADQHGGGGASQAGDGMMFCQPVTLVSELLNVLRQIHGAGDGAACGFAWLHAYEIQHRDCYVIAHDLLDEAVG
jgi:hypothetical protein